MHMPIKTVLYEPADYLTDDETIIHYLTNALETYDARIVAKALGAMARARGGIAQLARATGNSSEALHRALSDNSNPELATVLKVMNALGLRLSVTPVD